MNVTACPNCLTGSESLHLECRGVVIIKYLEDIKAQNEQYKNQVWAMTNHCRQLRDATRQFESECQRNAVKYQQVTEELGTERERREQAEKTADNLWAAIERASGFIQFVWTVCSDGAEDKKSVPTDLITVDSEGRCHAIDEVRAILEAYRFEVTMHETSLEERVSPILQAKNERITELEGILACQSTASSPDRGRNRGNRTRQRSRQRARRQFNRRDTSIASVTGSMGHSV